MINSMQNFHFLSPLWLLALLPMAGLLWFIFNQKIADHAWSKIIDHNLLPLLLNQGSATQQGKLALWLLAIAWLIGTIALANPAWEKKPRPVFQTNTARVIVFDLSRSMEIADLTPSRLARARFKIEDILRKQEEGQIGLVVFAGDAFTTVPLTRDADTIRALLPSLTPKIMPIQGSRADLGLLKAAELLQQANVTQGDILLISDGVEGNLAKQAAQQIAEQGHTVSVMAVGTEQGGAIPKVTDQQRNPIVVKLKPKSLQAVAEQGGGVYSPIQDNDTDLQQLLNAPHKGKKDNQHSADNINSDDWKEQGPLLVLLLLPFAALAFRRGWLLTIPLAVLIGFQPSPVFALAWDDLWLRADQQADKAFQTGAFETASEVAQDPMLRGNASYQQGNYQQAIDEFANAKGAASIYNKGNALAKLGRYKEAIDAYDEALQQQANFPNAVTNKKHVEKLLKQQEKQQNKKNDSKKSEQDGEKPDQADNPDQKKEQNKEQQDQQAPDKQQEQNQQKGEQQDASNEKNADNTEKSTEQKNNESKQDQNQQSNAFDQAAKEEEKKAEEPEQSAKQKPQQEQSPQQASSVDKNTNTAAEKEQRAEQLSREEKIAADQWLRRIPDNPGALLQRKFKYQYQQRRAPEGTRGSNPW